MVRSHALRRGLHSFAASRLRSCPGPAPRFFERAWWCDHTNAEADIDSAEVKSSGAVIGVTNAESWFQIGNRERASSEGAKECSPQRKLWEIDVW